MHQDHIIDSCFLIGAATVIIVSPLRNKQVNMHTLTSLFFRVQNKSDAKTWHSPKFYQSSLHNIDPEKE